MIGIVLKIHGEIFAILLSGTSKSKCHLEKKIDSASHSKNKVHTD